VAFLARTIYYYNIYITRNGRKTNLPFESLIDAIIPMTDSGKFWDRKKLSLLFVKPIDITHPIDCLNRAIAIAKYRDNYKPYTGRIGTNIANPIIEDVIEFTNCFYIGQTRQIAIEYNHFGSRHNEIAAYFSSFLPKGPSDYWDVVLEPIENNVGMRDVLNAEKVFSVEFTIDCTQEIDRTFETESFFGEFVEKTIDSHLQFGANVATIRFGNGKKRNDIIEANDLVRLLNHLDFEDDVFASVKVDYLSPRTGRRESINLKNQNILKSIILEGDTATGYEYILDHMIDKYTLENRPGSTAFRQFENQLEHENLPVITPHPIHVPTEAGA